MFRVGESGEHEIAGRMEHARALKEADDWLEEYRRLWEARLDRLDDYLKTLQAQQKSNKREKNHGRKK